MSKQATTITKAAELLGITEELLSEKNDLVIATEIAKDHGRRGHGMGSSDYSIQCEREYIYLDKGYEYEKKYTWLGFVKAVRLVYQEKNALEAAHAGKLTELASIEARIHFHVRTAYASIVEVGRCLIEAKATGLIPHGQWEAWVREHAQMTETRAQKLMKIAREVPENSKLSLLPISKIQEILSLPEPQREAMAQRAQAEDMTVKQLREEISAEKRRSEQLRTKYNRAIADRTEMEQGLSRKAAELAKERKSRRELLADMEKNHRAEVAELRKQITEAKAAPAGISPEAQKKIDDLEARLEDAERIADQQAELRQQTLQALQEAQSRASRGGAAIEEDLTAEAVITAARTFIGCVGYLPHSTKLCAVSQQDRQAIQPHVEMVAKWAEDMRAALDWDNVIVIEGA